MLMHLNFPLDHEKLNKAFLLALKNNGLLLRGWKKYQVDHQSWIIINADLDLNLSIEMIHGHTTTHWRRASHSYHSILCIQPSPSQFGRLRASCHIWRNVTQMRRFKVSFAEWDTHITHLVSKWRGVFSSLADLSFAECWSFLPQLFADRNQSGFLHPLTPTLLKRTYW